MTTVGGIPIPTAELALFFQNIWHVAKAWWWLPLPFLLTPSLLHHWQWWRNDVWSSKQDEKILLEIRIPEEVPKPIKAMENVFSSLWAFYDPPNWKEKWIDGKYLLSFSLEIVSIGGTIHFLIRTPKGLRNLVETSVYSQYPDADVTEFPDYTKDVPKDIPNAEWDLWGCSYHTIGEDIFPIRTYEHFFEPGGNVPDEEQRIDPLGQMLEGMSKMRPGEQLWVQIIVKPVTPLESDIVSRARAYVDKLYGKEKKKVPYSPVLQEASEVLVTGTTPEEIREREKSEVKNDPKFADMNLTPSERKKTIAVEDKISKYFFKTSIRFIYLGHKDVFYKPNLKLPIGYFVQLSTQDLLALKPYSRTVTGTAYWMVKRRVEFRKRRLIRFYRDRIQSPLFPQGEESGGKQGVFVLNTEELATLFHFPSRRAVPTPGVRRIDTKRAESPAGLPIIDEDNLPTA